MYDSDEEEENSHQGQVFCLKWVKQEHSLKFDKVQISTEQLQQTLMKEEPVGDDESQADIKTEIKDDKQTDDDLEGLEEFSMDGYSDEEDKAENFASFSSLYLPAPEENKYKVDEDESEYEEEALNLLDDDNLLICSNYTKDYSRLLVKVYNHNTKDFYVHHQLDIDNSTPLCLEWMSFDVPYDMEGNLKPGSFVAVGTLESTIQIWDLSTVNAVEPDLVFGKPRKPGSFNGTYVKDAHKDAVLDLSWNKLRNKNLASASADETVAIWDVERAAILRRYRMHEEKVQTLTYEPESAHNLLSGAFNGSIYLFDVRKKETNQKEMLNWKVDGQVERLCWNSFEKNIFAASTDKGTISYFDIRKPIEPLFTWDAHTSEETKAVPALSFNNKNLLYSASNGGMIKVWKIENDKANLVGEKNPNMGIIHCMSFNPDVDNVLVCGGEKNGTVILDGSKIYKDETSNEENINIKEEESVAKSVQKTQFKKKKKPRHRDRVKNEPSCKKIKNEAD